MRLAIALLLLAAFRLPAHDQDQPYYDLRADYLIYSSKPMTGPHGSEGIWVNIYTQNPACDAFMITLHYEDPQTGEPRAITQITRRTYYSNLPAPWSNELFWVGRVKVTAISVATLRITGGRTFKAGVDFAEK
jgi:hypothetical protein